MFVAEVSANHLGSIETALELIEAIATTGASHVKFQTYTADTMTLDFDGPDFRVSEGHELWGGRTLYSLYQEAHTPWAWHDQLFRTSRALGLEPFSSPFDDTAVDFLETLEPALYKVASMEITDLPLIRRIAQTGRPVVMSTGTAELAELDDAVAAIEDAGCTDLTLLLCTSAYPTPPEDVHLSRMDFLRRRYGVPVGLSDHTIGIGVSVGAAALGAVVIERHVTLRRGDGGPDSAFSLEPSELAQLVDQASTAARAVGDSEWNPIEAERESRRFKRSLFVTRDCEAGETLSRDNVRSIRPAGGLPPKYLDQILGSRLTGAVRRGSPLTFEMIQGGKDLASMDLKHL